MSWSVPRIWEGGDVWILGGGPSLTQQFGIPDEVVTSVKSGASSPAVYSPYMSFLHDKHVIGINVAYLIGEWIDMVFFGDHKFFLRHREQLAAWPGIKVTCHHEPGKVPWVKFVPRNMEHPQGISPKPNQVSWNLNSGASAISIAANMGAKRIFLLGFDMQLINGDQHWHKLYRRPADAPPPTRRGGLPQTRKFPFDRHLKGFPAIARDAQIRGIEIINVSPNSAITVFPKKSLKEVMG